MSFKWFDPRRFLGFMTARADDFLKNEQVRVELREQGDKGARFSLDRDVFEQ